MKVIIGSARINEFGQIEGGTSGDQTGKEVCTENWYLHKDGWVIIRAYDKEVAEKIAEDMQYICDNDNIGYDQPTDMTLFYEARKYDYDASKVTKPCNTDCAKAVLVCVYYAGVQCEVFYTADEISKLEKTGEFQIIRDNKITSVPDYLKRGDILCTPVKGHTVVVLEVKEENSMMYCNTEDSGVYKVKKDVNLREFCGTGYRKLCVLYSGEEVYSDGIQKTVEGSKWLHVIGKQFYGDGFVNASYLEKENV